ncbi:MAG: YhdH/YhfP family quinone oxidoreductase [Bacteroidetes bacterium]|nr:YhdH/YhfP family quinone oxidoreductase [Bacteroidota bacterium]
MEEFRALWVSEDANGNFDRKIIVRKTTVLEEKGVLIKVSYSSLNYKDALSSTGNKGVTRRYPHTPGIDAAGTVEQSNSPDFKIGDPVIVTGYDLGMNTCGGFGGYINVPSGWVVPMPAGLSAEDSMTLGTAGFTAALAVHHLIRSGQKPDSGSILVTGASGGVGCLTVALLSVLGFEVIASTGKPGQHDLLKRLGAKTIIDRAEVDDKTNKALLKPRWSGAIDTAGGNILATVLKACAEHGNVASCGNVASPLLNTTVFPFILNGVNLLGVNSATTPMVLRKEIWLKLANEWKIPHLAAIRQVTSIDGLEDWIQRILKGEVAGRVVVRH